MIGDIRRILLIPHLKVQNANALSSPFTIGFPAMTAWLGAVHTLQRKLNASEFGSMIFKKTAVISHKVDLQIYKGEGGYVNSIIGSANPLNKDGERPTFIEEPRTHLDVSLLIEYNSLLTNEYETFLEKLSHYLTVSIKIAGGDIFSFDSPSLHKIEEGNDEELRKLIRLVMPGHAIIERRELMLEAMQQGQDAIGALLDYLAVHHSSEKDENGTVTWRNHRKVPGWIVPVATGFHGITELGQAKNQRDPTTPHRFAESVVTLGEFRMPHRIHSLDEIFWQYYTDLSKHLYLCQQGSHIEE